MRPKKARGRWRRRMPAALRGIAVAAAVTLALAAPAAAQAYSVTTKVVPGGGTNAAIGGSYELAASAGQPEAGAHAGGLYTLNAGFWPMLALCLAPAGIPSITLSQASVIAWGAVPGAASYDVVSGDLGLLRTTNGDFAAATDTCVASALAATSTTFAPVPALRAGFFLLTRARACAPGTWDSDGAGQIASRDVEIDAAGVCP